MNGSENHLSTRRVEKQDEEIRRRLLDLCRGPNALFTYPSRSYPSSDLPCFAQVSTRTRAGVHASRGSRGLRATIQAHGSGEDPGQALLRALAEALERYCATVYLAEQLVQASACELGTECLDLDTIPHVSDTEAANAKCPIRRASKTEQIRWVKALCLTDRKECWVPAVMVYSELEAPLPGEKFWLPISTGCAAYTDIDTALLSGLLEVIERDAIVLTWLQELKLPEIVLDEMPDELSTSRRLLSRSSAAVDFRFFDATTDMGVPIVYGLRIAKHCVKTHTLVGCSAARTITDAVGKVLRDLVSLGGAFERTRQIPAKFEDFCQIFHGAAYMAHRDQSNAFNFLTSHREGKLLSHYPAKSQPEMLQQVLDLCRTRHISVYAVDLTTSEAAAIGFKVVRVIVPALQPLSFAYTAQYRGHERLYTAPLSMGHPVRPESQLNNRPQPFA